MKRRSWKGDAAGICDLRRLRLAAAGGSLKRPSSRRPSPTTFVRVTNRFCPHYPHYRPLCRSAAISRVASLSVRLAGPTILAEKRHKPVSCLAFDVFLTGFSHISVSLHLFRVYLTEIITKAVRITARQASSGAEVLL